ncbi:MAG: PD-(D/E)XK nuclease family protein [Bacteroidales bacterium]|nr:PD-(D/E)XK nuclease family protein [Bacteroidales bacterium]
MVESFLHFLAREYCNRVDSKDLCRYCFVFPNQRSGKFFEKELGECIDKPLLLPAITTINGFVSDLTGAVEANRIELLTILYKAYKDVMKDNSAPFDRFARWGDVLLSDFGDADRYMVDAKSLFVNISELKQIKSNYLDELPEEVKKSIAHFFNFDFEKNNQDEFWQHISRDNGDVEIREKFTGIWSQLYNIYEKFNQYLDDAGLTYGGKMYRDAAIRAKKSARDDFEHVRYVFSGFNVLSKSEHELFKAMQKKGNTDFHWDYNTPAFRTGNNKGTKFLSKYVKEFKPPFEMEKNDSFPPNMYAIGVPSNYAQVRYADAIIRELVKKGKTDRANAIDTAVVLPDEQLFMPMVKAVSLDTVDKINVTMGLSIRNSSIATLMSAISKMHYQAKKVSGEWTYFHADVKDILLHPIVKLFDNEGSVRLIDELTSENCFQVSYAMIEQYAPKLASLFSVVEEFTTEEVSDYLQGVIEFTDSVLQRQQQMELEVRADSGETDDDEEQNPIDIERAFIESYRDALAQLCEVLNNANLVSGDRINVTTFCFLLDRLIGSTKVAFEGEPLGGLQIMGLLETRCLDFKNLIILSMNERIFPRKHFTKSFIPQNFRKAREMSTLEHQESMYAYYFYRMISRAENVFMLYDSRTQGASSGEESRFIRQLDILYSDKCHIHRVMPGLGIKAPQTCGIEVAKDERVMEILNKYKCPLPESEDEIEKKMKSGELKLLSAHSLNAYIECPVRFYLRYVEGLAEIEEVSEFMDASTFGTIIHETIQQLYKNGSKITTEYIDKLLARGNKIIDNTIIANVNRIFFKKGENCYDELYGECMLKFDIMKIFITRILEYDKKELKKYGEINYIQGEKRIVCKLPIDGSEHAINLTYTIDRLDSVQEDGKEVLRIIDYKTGKDKTRFVGVESLFDNSVTERKKSLFQLLLYCKALSQEKEFAGKDIKPIIYKLLNMNDTGVFYKKSNASKPVQVVYPDMEADDGKKIKECFESHMATIINELFDPKEPFVQTANEKNCKYCKFKDFCRKE